MSRAAVSQARPAGSSRGRELAAFAGPVSIWLAFSFIMAGYSALRAVCDSFGSVTEGRAVEQAMFGSIPTLWLQDQIYGERSRLLDYAGFAVHAAWFVTPYAFGFFVMARTRRRLMEFFWWIIAASFLGCVGYGLLPTAPPWMEPDIARIMHERPLWTRFDYLEADANEVAAFPSLHAALPLVVGLFCLLRVPQLRWLGWVGVGQALVTGAFMVYLGEHWVFDILGGYALAGVVAVAFARGWASRGMDALPFSVGTRAHAFNVLVFPERPVAADVDARIELPRAA